MSQLLEYLPETEKTYYRESLIQYQRGKYFAKFNWSAFLFGNLWMFYRKMYSVGLGIASIGFINDKINKNFFNNNIFVAVVLTFVLHIFVGFYGTAMYAEFLDKRMKKGKPFPPIRWWNTSLIVICFIIGNIILFQFGN